eukprot:Hpha_TRINITY_DN16296_c2_g17::TRINITY_DN16296_c2_g17_i1::g.11411::m.11411
MDSLLEKAQEVERRERDLQRRKEELSSEERKLKELRAASQSGVGRRGLHQDLGSEDFLDTIQRLEHELRLQNLKIKALEKECKDMHLKVKKTEKQCGQHAAHVAKVESVTGYKLDPETGLPSSPLHRHKGPTKEFAVITPYEQVRIINDLQAIKNTLEMEFLKTQNIVQRKTELIHRLAQEADDVNEFEERRYSKQNELNVLNQELEKLTLEWDTLRREHMKADVAIGKAELAKDQSRATHDSLQADKLFLRKRIDADVGDIRDQQRASEAQEFRLRNLRERLEVITAAVEDLNMWSDIHDRLRGIVSSAEQPSALTDRADIVPQNETIDVYLYELLARDVQAIESSIALKDLILHEKIDTIEALEAKIEDIQSQNQDETQAKNAELCAREQSVIELNEMAWSDREEINKGLVELQQKYVRAKFKKMELQKQVKSSKGR